MGVRQYIGARYVPLYVGDWDNTRNYEPLSIVTDANGNSFTSLKDVPAGTALNNRDYWIQTSSFSGAVDTLRRDMNQAQADISNLQPRMTTAEGDIDSLEGRMTTAEGDIDSLEGRMTTAEGDIDSLENKINKRIYMISDSYGNRTQAQNLTYADVLRNRGFNITDVAISGAGFERQDAALKFITQLDTYSGDKSLVTDIIVIGGANDMNSADVDSLVTLINQFIDKANADYPNARVHLFHAGVCFTQSWSRYAVRTVAAYKKAASRRNAYYATNSEYVLRNTQILEADGIHPNQIGVQELAGQIQQYIETGTCDVEYLITASATYKDGYTSETAYETIQMHRKNGIVTILGYEGQGRIYSLFANISGASVRVENMINFSDVLYNEPGNERYIAAMCKYRNDTDSVWNTGFFNLTIYNKSLYVIMFPPISGGKYYNGIWALSEITLFD